MWVVSSFSLSLFLFHFLGLVAVAGRWVLPVVAASLAHVASVDLAEAATLVTELVAVPAYNDAQVRSDEEYKGPHADANTRDDVEGLQRWMKRFCQR